MIRRGLAKVLTGQDEQMREVLGKAALSLILRVGGAAAQFAFTVLIARMFGPAGLGRYALALSVVVIASTFGRWGVDQASLKYVAIHAARGEQAAVKRMIWQAAWLVIVGSLVVTMLLLAVVPWLSRQVFHDPELTWLMRLMTLSIVPFSLLNLVAEAHRGLRRIGSYTVIQGVLVPLLSISLLLVFHQLGGMELYAVALAYVIACLLTTSAALFLWRLSLGSGGKGEGTAKATPVRTMLATANPMAWVALISVAMSFTETMLLGIFWTSEEVGLYAAALRLALLLNFVIIAFNSILAPKFAALYHAGNLESMHMLARRSVTLMLLVTSPIFLLFFLMPDQALGLFGSQFSGTSRVLRVLTLGQLINIATGPVGIMLLMTGHERLMRSNLLVAALCSIVFGTLMVSRFGVIGAAISAAFAMLVLNGLSVWGVRRKLGRAGVLCADEGV